ncbi:MAG: type VI secretion system baseplate subunit TssK [Deltaproteobacteria bacterium]|nr:type VI secretion system baseplate subunit TssK [Deltaproteobacteria bacterium]
MSRSHKVVWSEGIFLTPHLFQQADRYYESLVQFKLKPLSPFYWGLSELEIDKEGLPNGFFTVYRCSGVMPDGLAIQIADGDEAPESRSVKDYFPPSAAKVDVYLAVPISRPNSINFKLSDGNPSGYSTRYQMQLLRVPDETTEGNECEIPLARKNYKTLFSGELLDDTTWIKIAELTRTASGTIVLQDSYVPPSITLSASETLMAVLHRLLEMLSAKSSALSQQRRHIAEFGVSDVANFWLLHTVNSYVPILSHFYNVPDRHPEQLYMVLSQLAGELTTFALQVDPRELPRYDHTNLGKTFSELEEKIRFLLETVIPTRYVIIPLEKTPELLYIGRIHDDRLLKAAQFYLGANSELAGNRLIEEIPAKSKISSPDEINGIIGRAVPGVELSYEPVPPTAIPVKPGFKYFHLLTRGRWWEAICKSKSLALYLPDEFPELRLELIAVKEQ